MLKGIQLIQSDPDLKMLLIESIKQKKQEYDDLREKKEAYIGKYKEEQKELAELFFDSLYPQPDYYPKLKEEIKRMLKMLELSEDAEKLDKEQKKQLDIERAKQYNILSLLQELGQEVNRAGFLKCPFHQDKTASLKVYTKNNTFYCFGCHTSGDQIDFVSRYLNYSFKEAVNYLNR